MNNRSIECRRHVELEASLRLALEALENPDGLDEYNRSISNNAITAIKEALSTKCVEQPEHSATHGEPVAVVDLRNVNYVRWLDGAVFFEGTKLYTTLPQRKPLTDEQIETIWHDFHDREFGYAIRFARAIEAAQGIKEKNTSNGGCA